MTAWPKIHHGCGAVFTEEQWKRLERIPDWRFDDGVVLEQRNCVCGSTLAIEVDDDTKDEAAQ